MKGLYLLACVCIAMLVSIECNELLDRFSKQTNNNGGHACDVAKEVTPEYLTKWNNKTAADFEEPQLAEPRYKFGCFAACWMQNRDIITGDKVNVTKIIDILQLNIDSSEEISLEKLQSTPEFTTVRNCATEANSLKNICEIGWKFGKCVSHLVGL